MEVEAVIIDGQKYVPVDSISCGSCDLNKISGCSAAFGVPVCKLFDGHAVKCVQSPESLQPHQLKEIFDVLQLT